MSGAAVAFAAHGSSSLAMRMFMDAMHPLLPYLDDPHTQEVMINAPGDVWVERAGQMTRVPEGNVIRDEDITTAAKALATANDKDLVRVLDCRMPGFRIAAAMPPIAINGPTICIRKHGRIVLELDDYLAAGAFSATNTGPGRHDAGREVPHQDVPMPSADAIAAGDEGVRDFLSWMVRSYKNFLIAGGTSSGKTTFMNALLAAVPDCDRVVTIEDTAELKIKAPNRVMLESNPLMGVSIRDLVRLSLRYRPDRIVVGEVRGGESYDLLDALNTGHSGGGASIHANSAASALERLENLVRMSPDAANIPLLALRQQIASAINYVIFCSRRGGPRGPRSILRIDGLTPEGAYRTTTIFGHDPQGDDL